MTKLTNEQVIIVKRALDNLVEGRGILKDMTPVLVKILDTANQLVDQIREQMEDKLTVKAKSKEIEEVGQVVDRLNEIVSNLDDMKDQIEKFSLDDLMRELRKIIK